MFVPSLFSFLFVCLFLFQFIGFSTLRFLELELFAVGSLVNQAQGHLFTSLGWLIRISSFVSLISCCLTHHLSIWLFITLIIALPICSFTCAYFDYLFVIIFSLCLKSFLLLLSTCNVYMALNIVGIKLFVISVYN